MLGVAKNKTKIKILKFSNRMGQPKYLGVVAGLINNSWQAQNHMVYLALNPSHTYTRQTPYALCYHCGPNQTKYYMCLEIEPCPG